MNMDVNMDLTLHPTAGGGYGIARPTTPEINVQATQVASTQQPREREGAVREVPQIATVAAAAAPVRPSSATPAENAGTMREEDVSDYMIERAFDDANRALAGGTFGLSFSIHEATNRVSVTVYNSQTGEPIRQLPSESRLDIYARIAEFTGLLFDSSS